VPVARAAALQLSRKGIGVSEMDSKRLNYFRERLRQKQLSLNAMVQRTEGYGREKEQDIQDVADMAVESYTKEFMFGKSSGDRHILQLIQEALDRIEDKSYGTCVNCENAIQPKRLEAVPWTRLCIQCQDLLEKGLLEL
jgi:DnaK suppressor protein